MYLTQVKDDKIRIPQPQKFLTNSIAMLNRTDRLSADASISPEKPLSEKASERVVSFFEWVFLTTGHWVTSREASNTMDELFVYQRHQRDE